jgi:hypothetical protein
MKALKNLFDGSMPVIEFGDEKNESASVKKFVVYFERVSRSYADPLTDHGSSKQA